MNKRWDWDRFWVLTLLWVTFAAAVLFIAAAAHDGEGRASGDHVGPRPAQVTELTSDAFLLPPLMNPHEVCGGGVDSNGHDAVNSAVQVPSIERQFVLCRDPQHWNTTLPGSMNYWHSYGYMASRPYIWGTLAGLYLLLALTVFAPMAIESQRARVLARRKAERAEREKRSKLENARRELRAAYASDEIGTETFERKLAELYEQGLPPA